MKILHLFKTEDFVAERHGSINHRNVSVVVQSMKKWPMDEDIQKFGFWVLYKVTLTNLGKFSKAMWKDRCTKVHEPNNTSSSIADLLMQRLLIAIICQNPQDILAAETATELLNGPICLEGPPKRQTLSQHQISLRGIYTPPRPHRRFLAEQQRLCICRSCAFVKMDPALPAYRVNFLYSLTRFSAGYIEFSK